MSGAPARIRCALTATIFIAFSTSSTNTRAARPRAHAGETRALGHPRFVTLRRGERLGARGVQRALAAVRSFFRWLAREEILENAARARSAPRASRAPCRGRQRNRRGAHARRAGETMSNGWARRDAALLTLLYGAGLRISEGLSLKRGDVPLGASLNVVGKGRKERSVPLLPVVREAAERYASLIPFSGAREEPLFLSRRGKPMSAREAQALMQRLRGRLGLGERATPHALRIPSPPICSRAAAICARAGTARPRFAVHHPDLHRNRHQEDDGSLCRGSSAREERLMFRTGSSPHPYDAGRKSACRTDSRGATENAESLVLRALRDSACPANSMP